MGFAKYSEDNMEIWFERNRARNNQSNASVLAMYGSNGYMLRGNMKNTNIPLQNSNRQYEPISKKGGVSYGI